jgi:hypothetical protein
MHLNLNPDEGIWSYLKYRELKNVVCQNQSELRYELRWRLRDYATNGM